MTTGSEYPYRFERTATIGPLRERHAGLEAGTDTGEQVSVAGRVIEALAALRFTRAYKPCTGQPRNVRRGLIATTSETDFRDRGEL